jgi:hypothetical protein
MLKPSLVSIFPRHMSRQQLNHPPSNSFPPSMDRMQTAQQWPETGLHCMHRTPTRHYLLGNCPEYSRCMQMLKLVSMSPQCTPH